MSDPIKTFVDFASLLRAHNFAVSPDQTMAFIEAIGLLGPSTMEDIRRAAVAMFAIPKEREAEFDTLFKSHFYGQVLAPTVAGEEADELEIHEPGQETREIQEDEGEETPGVRASTAETLSHRGFNQSEDVSALDRFARKAPRALPKRLSYRFTDARRGQKLNMRKLIKQANRTDGDPVLLPWKRRKERQRKILLLIDVSGSMRDQSEFYLEFAHVLSKISISFECYTLGTRLTRITNSLKPRDPELALSRVSQAVADMDGGTRIGDALQAFLAIPRYTGHARGALVLVFSDGLERGDAQPMIEAVGKLSKIAWRIHWLSPLASADDFKPETEAIRAILPLVDDLSGAGDLGAVCDHVLNIARAA
ncbi:MAG: VWA domain-containing protein [Pseudomonadota bacterium]